jgi:PKD repeat protein
MLEATDADDVEGGSLLLVAHYFDASFGDVQIFPIGAQPANQPPRAELLASPTEGTPPLPVTFDGSASDDPDGQVVSWAWTFGDGANDVGPIVNHVYGSDGNYTATLTVTDDDGRTHSKSVTIAVATPANPPPTAVFAATPTSGTTPFEVYFDASGSTDPGGGIVGYDWDFGDGSNGSGQITTHEYTANSTFIVNLTVTDGQNSASASDVIVADSPDNLVPVAQGVAGPATVNAPTTFDGSGSTDDGTIIDWGWAFGDGTSGTGEHTEHTYAAAGTFEVTLWVTDDAGARGLVRFDVEVEPGLANDGLVALYEFEEGSGSVARDTSGVAPALDLTLRNPGAGEWTAGGLRTNGTILESSGSANKITNRVIATNAYTLEAWIRESNFAGANKRIAIIGSASDLNMALTRGISTNPAVATVRSRSSGTTTTGRFLASTPGELQPGLNHVAVTRSSNRVLAIWINGVKVNQRSTPGSLANWSDALRLTLGGDPNLKKLWRGEYLRVAIYDRALDNAEIQQNYQAGP